MTDLPGSNPFADIDPQMSAAPNAALKGTDPFADMNLPPVAHDVGAVGSFLGHAASGVLPSFGGMAGAGAGAEAGMAIGALTSPLTGPIGPAVGGFLGGLGGFWAGAAATQGVQDFAVHQMPDNWQDTIGQSDRVKRMQEQERPYASFFGGIAPYALTMTPGAWTTKAANLPADATAFQRIRANPLTSRALGGAMMGGLEGLDEWRAGESPDWIKLAVSTGFGVVFNKPTTFGETLTGLGAAPMHAAMAPVRNTAAGMEMLRNPMEGAVPTRYPLWNPEHEAYEPTVAQAWDLGVVGIGNTEATYRGGAERSDVAKTAAQNAAADEQAVIGPAPEPNTDAIARRMHPELFAENDRLLSLRDSLRQYAEGQSNPPQSAFDDLAAQHQALTEQLAAEKNRAEQRRIRVHIRDVQGQIDELQTRRDAYGTPDYVPPADVLLARQHLMDTDYALRDLGPEIAAARRRAADHAGQFAEPEAVPEAAEPAPAPEPTGDAVKAETTAPATPAPEAPAPRTIEQQRAAIAADRTAQLMSIGMSRAHAETSAHVDADYYVTLAHHMGGKLGTAEDLYRELSEHVIGPNGKSAAPPMSGAQPKPRTIAKIQSDENVSARKAADIQKTEAAPAQVLEPVGAAAPATASRAEAKAAPAAKPLPWAIEGEKPRVPFPEEMKAAGIPASKYAATRDEAILRLVDWQAAHPAGRDQRPATTPQPSAAAAAVPATPPSAVPAERPRLRTAKEIMDQDKVGPSKVEAIQEAELEALSNWQRANPPAEPRATRIKRNHALDLAAHNAGIAPAETQEATCAAIVEALPVEKVVEEVRAEAEAGDIEFREAEAEAAEIIPEVKTDPDVFYDGDQSRSLEELESEHRPAEDAAATEQRPGGGGEHGPAAEDQGQIPESGGPSGRVVGAGEGAVGEGGGSGAAGSGDVGSGPEHPIGSIVTFDLNGHRREGVVSGGSGNVVSIRTETGTHTVAAADITPTGREGVPIRGTGADALRDVTRLFPDTAPEFSIAEALLHNINSGSSKLAIAAHVLAETGDAGQIWALIQHVKDALPGRANEWGEVRRVAGEFARGPVETPAPLIPTAEKPDVPAHTAGNGGLEALDPADIGVDAARFQFKAGGDEAGVTDRLQGVQKWDARLAGTALVFRDADGRNWIADGHQRLGLAQRLAAEGQSGIRLNAFVLDAKDGITDSDARSIAAAKNIAEGTGTAIDAAKVIREAATSGIELPPLPPKSTLVRDGRALARLGPDAFGMAVNDVIPVQQAAIVGRLIADHAQQAEAIRVLAKAKPDNARQAEMIVRDVLETGTEDATKQGGLFGDEHFASSAVLERARVADEAMRQLARDKTTFKTLVSEAERIQSHGKNELDVRANQSRLTADEQAKQFLTQLATRKGPVSDALTGIARRVKSGDISAAEGAREFLGVLRSHVEGELGARPDVGGAVAGAAAPSGNVDLFGTPVQERVERVAEPTIHNDQRQSVMPGMESSARQAQAAKDAAGPRGGQEAANEGLFAPKETEQPELSAYDPTTPWTGRDRIDAARLAEASKGNPAVDAVRKAVEAGTPFAEIAGKGNPFSVWEVRALAENGGWKELPKRNPGDDIKAFVQDLLAGHSELDADDALADLGGVALDTPLPDHALNRLNSFLETENVSRAAIKRISESLPKNASFKEWSEAVQAERGKPKSVDEAARGTQEPAPTSARTVPVYDRDGNVIERIAQDVESVDASKTAGGPVEFSGRFGEMGWVLKGENRKPGVRYSNILQQIDSLPDSETPADRAISDAIAPAQGKGPAPVTSAPKADNVATKAAAIESGKNAPATLRAMYEVSKLRKDRGFRYPTWSLEHGMAPGEWEAEQVYETLGRGETIPERRARFDAFNEIAEKHVAETDRQEAAIYAKHGVTARDREVVNNKLAKLGDKTSAAVGDYLKAKYGPDAEGNDLFQRQTAPATLAPAVKVNGKVYAGTDHANASGKVPREGNEDAASTYGFVDDRGRFLDRTRAYEYAEAHGLLAPGAEGRGRSELVSDALRTREPEQRTPQTETPAFRAWFGDSRVVDAEGKPLVVYHSSDADFSRFAKSKLGSATKGNESSPGALGTAKLGFWFSDHPLAERVGRSVEYPVHLAIEYPKEIRLDHLIDLCDERGWRSVLQRFKDNGYDGLKVDDQEFGGTSYVAFSPTQIKSAIGNRGTFDPTDPSILHQSANAKIRMFPGEARSVIHMFSVDNPSTFMHEASHGYLKNLLRFSLHEAASDVLKTDAATVRRWLKRPDDWTGFLPDGRVDRAPHERFARTFEQYLREGVAPSPGLASVFAKFKSWLMQIYQSIRSVPGSRINEDIRGVFDRMLAVEPRRTVYAPEREAVPDLHAIHEADAAETEPHEAEAVRDRVVSERDRAIVNHPPEIASELRDAEPAADEPADETGAGSEGHGEVDQDSGKPEPVARSGGGGAGGGKVEPGGGKAVPKSDGMGGGATSAERRSGNSESAGPAALAPKPADTFRDDAGSTEAVDLAGNIRAENLTPENFRQSIHDSAERNDEFRNMRPQLTKGQILDLRNDFGLGREVSDSEIERRLSDMFGGMDDLARKVAALRVAVAQSAEIVHGLMDVAGKSDDPKDLAKLGVAIARHDMMQGWLAKATHNWGQTGTAFHSLLDGWDKAQDINQLLRDNLGRDLYQLKIIAKLGARMDTPAKVSKLLRDAKERSFGRMILEYWINGLISGLTTHVTYTVGNAILTAEKAGPETAIAAAIGSARARFGRAGDRVLLGEVAAQFKAAGRELPAAVQAALESYRSGVTTMLPGETARALIPFQGDMALTVSRGMTNDHVTWKDVRGDAYALIQGMRDGLVASGELIKAGGVQNAPTFGAQYAPGTQIPDFAYKGVNVLPLGTLARLPSRNVAAIHSTFRALNYSMEINALAYRHAAGEGLSGTALDARVAELRQNPPPEMMEQARGRATELTLMGEAGEWVKKLSQWVNADVNLPLLGKTPILKFVDPFVHIAANIMDQSLVQRTPIGLLSPQIREDLMGRTGISAADYAAGKRNNIAADTAAAKMLVGTAISIMVGGLAAQGLVSGSGPSDPAKAAMWGSVVSPPHSIRVGDIWYDVHRLGPMGMLISVAADMYDVAHQIGREDADVVGKSLLHAFSQNILDESFMRGPSDLIRAVTDPDRYGSGYVRTFLSSFVPYSVGMAQMARASDPYSRQARTIMDAIKQKIPGLSETLLPRRDIWGEPIPNSDALIAPGITAIYARKMSTDPVNLAMISLGIAPAQPERSIRNVKLTDEQYDDFARVAGRSTKMQLDRIVRNPDFQSWPPATKHEVIEEVLRQSREAARGWMMMRYPEIPRQAAQMQVQRRTGEPAPIGR